MGTTMLRSRRTWSAGPAGRWVGYWGGAGLHAGVASADSSTNWLSSIKINCWVATSIPGGRSSPGFGYAGLIGRDPFVPLRGGRQAIAVADPGNVAMAIGLGVSPQPRTVAFDFAFADGTDKDAEAAEIGHFNVAVADGADDVAQGRLRRSNRYRDSCLRPVSTPPWCSAPTAQPSPLSREWTTTFSSLDLAAAFGDNLFARAYRRPLLGGRMVQ